MLGCTSHQDPTVATRVVRTSGSAVALSRDERIAVVTNRSAGSVSVFAIASVKGQTRAEIVQSFSTGAGSEPWASVIDRNDDTAYVLFRNSGTVRRLTSLHGVPKLEDTGVSVGAEPTAIAISPSGQKLFVANFGEGSVSVITTVDFVSPVKIDLNQSLVDTGVLGSVTARPGLAHPRALALTDNGDDSDLDETLYATEFFSQPLPGVQPDPDTFSDVDRNRQGFVYPMSMKTGQPGTPISVAPVAATGFADANGWMTSCFPNQLYAAAVNGGRLYVTSMCTSPRGPLGPGPSNSDGTPPSDNNFKTLFHPAVFVIDTKRNLELPEQGKLLTAVLDGYYKAGEDPQSERMPLIPNEITFANSGGAGAQAYVSALGADALFRLDYDASGGLRSIGDPGARYVDVQAEHGLPVGVALSKSSMPPFALVVSDAKLRLSIIDRNTARVTPVDSVADATFADQFRKSDEAQGRGFFGTGRDIWSLKGQAWSSCESCHPGGLSDGVTWFFARGPRRTISTAGTYDKRPDPTTRSRRLMLWGANIDEVHDIEAIVRGVSGGVGAVQWLYAPDSTSNDCRLLYDGSAPPSSGHGSCLAAKPTSNLQNGLNGALSSLDDGSPCRADSPTCDVDNLPDWRKVDSFIRAERAPHGPRDLLADDVIAGRALFEQGRCAGCHGGPAWTVSKLFYPPGAEQNGELPYTRPASAAGLRLGALRTNSYSVPDELLSLNPAALAGSVRGQASFRNAAAPDASDAEVLAAAYASQTDDQIRCALRDVGTFPSTVDQLKPGSVTVAGAPRSFELRQDMAKLAQGASGFNVPSLFGLSLGAPYFHAGNARTLEELFDSTFQRHHLALAPGFLADASQRNQQIAQLVSFLLAIDEDTAPVPVPTTNAAGAALNYDFCQQP